MDGSLEDEGWKFCESYSEVIIIQLYFNIQFVMLKASQYFSFKYCLDVFSMTNEAQNFSQNKNSLKSKDSSEFNIIKKI